MLNKKGIKVLSLFFIYKVSNYREYDKDNNPIKGYIKLITLDKYRENQNKDLEVSFTHNGYFTSHRKKGK